MVFTVKNCDRGLENATRDRRQHFQDRFSIPRKVTCQQSLHVARNITRQITRHIARQITLQRTSQLTHNITPQIPRHTIRQIIVIIISDGFVGTVAISYQVAITFSRKANLRSSLQHFYLYFKVKSLLGLYFKGALQRCFAPF